MKVFDVVILGAGASGLMCSAILSRNKTLKVAIIDANSDIGAKIKISGGSKCNITNINVSENNYLGDSTFIQEVFSQFSKEDLLEFLKKHSIELEIRKKQYYFCKHSAMDVINLFKHLTKESSIYLNETLLHVKRKEFFEITTNKQTLRAKKVVVATGGASFKLLGASDIGLEIAKSFEHKLKVFEPALVGLTLQPEQKWMKELSGVSMRVSISVEDKLLEEDMLFAHKGISGPAVLSASLYWKKGKIGINFLPESDLDTVLNTNKQLSNALGLPKRFILEFLKQIGLKDKVCNRLTCKEKENLKKIQNYTFAPAGNFGFTKAEVSRGGVDTSTIDVNSMQSKKEKGLFFIGEVVDITGELGGYNFQWAFSSAVICANFIQNN